MFSDFIVALDCVGRAGNILLIEVMVRVRVLMTTRVLSSAGLWDGHLRFIFFLKVYLFIFITVFFGCTGPSWLHAAFSSCSE